uniref:SDR family NAD(P)-dependent oxidoreductase n=1 Tax=Sphingomonas populi TaxID=2484750 RepID=UPI001E5C9FFB|nr:SDR family oxidoreductase [Sphingomonas populi]
MKRLEGKVAIVTGGAGGIGAAATARFVSEGAHVVVADIDEARAKEVADRHGDKAFACAFDAADNESVRALMDGTAARFGRIDVLYNNLAQLSEVAVTQDTTVVDTPFEVWNDLMAINAGSYFAACKFAIPHMLANGGGAIINTATGCALAGDVRRTSYGASKAAVVALTKYVATQYGKQGIRCNTIAPGLILTETLKRASPELLNLMSRHILTPRLGQPEDIAALAAFLASDESGYINGELIACDGGLLAHLPQTAEIEDLMNAQS